MDCILLMINGQSFKDKQSCRGNLGYGQGGIINMFWKLCLQWDFSDLLVHCCSKKQENLRQMRKWSLGIGTVPVMAAHSFLEIGLLA